MTFPIVELAASAGGLEALSEFLGEVPAQSGMAFVVIQHLDPKHDSLLTEILGKKASIRVRQAEEGGLVEPDHAYVIPPNRALTLRDDDRLHLGPRAPGREGHMPGDTLFRSLAEVRGETAIGIVLSGGDSDGASGIQAIKHAGALLLRKTPILLSSLVCRGTPSRPGVWILCCRRRRSRRN